MLHVRRFNQGILKSAFRFSTDDIEWLERAVARTTLKHAVQLVCVRGIVLKTRCVLDIGAKHGAVRLRIRTPDSATKQHVSLEGDALAAFCAAVAEFKKAGDSAT